MKKSILIAFLILVSLGFTEHGKDAYLLCDSKGKKTDYASLLMEAKKADIILFGELHDNPICHWLQKELTQDLYLEVKDKLVLGEIGRAHV